ncbi:MAG: AAA family ATPase [Alphaproteobacteria bacterium]|nr:AAA family ATPase [Alphaproteobacteria bacterium]
MIMGLRQTKEAGIDACAIARDVQAFDLLIEDMETELGERWGGLDFVDGLAYVNSPEATELEFIAVAVDQTDEEDLSDVIALIQAAAAARLKVILVAHDLSPTALHQLLRLGASDFAPYPLPEGALHDAIERMRKPATPTIVHNGHSSEQYRNGAILPIFGLAGGVGSTMLAVNLAWELALQSEKSGLKVCLLDLDLQGGSVATYLDLPRREAIFELLSDSASMDSESFSQTMLSYNDKLDVLTAPADALPLEILTPEDVGIILKRATELYDFVVIDMPTTLVQWTETILQEADVFFAMMEMDMRSAQNALRFVRTLKAEDLPFEKVRYVMNYAPKFADMGGRARIKRLAENLNIEINLFFTDGGKQILHACDHGLPIAESAPKNPLRKEIAKLARSIFELATEQAAVG